MSQVFGPLLFFHLIRRICAVSNKIKLIWPSFDSTLFNFFLYFQRVDIMKCKDGHLSVCLWDSIHNINTRYYFTTIRLPWHVYVYDWFNYYCLYTTNKLLLHLPHATLCCNSFSFVLPFFFLFFILHRSCFTALTPFAQNVQFPERFSPQDLCHNSVHVFVWFMTPTC